MFCIIQKNSKEKANWKNKKKNIPHCLMKLCILNKSDKIIYSHIFKWNSLYSRPFKKGKIK